MGEHPTGQSAFRGQLYVQLLGPLPPLYPVFPTLAQASRMSRRWNQNVIKPAADLGLRI